VADGVPAGLADATADSHFQAGSLIASYLILEEIGRGGMAVVYRARDVRLDRWVALKILGRHIAGQPTFRQRFIQESRAAAAVDHPNIIPIFDAGEADGVLYIAMRYVAARDVHSLIKQAGPLPAARAISIITQVASALDAAHARGLVHRDVKPANMLLDSAAGDDTADHIYLSDFGISKQAPTDVHNTGDHAILAGPGPGQQAGPASRLTLTGEWLGTMHYAAPEQVQGRPVDGRADVYSLACAAFEMLAGEPPFAAERARASEPGPVPSLASRRPDLPPAIDQVMVRALATAPADRYGTCRALAAALAEACGLAPGVPPDGPVAAEADHPGARPGHRDSKQFRRLLLQTSEEAYGAGTAAARPASGRAAPSPDADAPGLDDPAIGSPGAARPGRARGWRAAGAAAATVLAAAGVAFVLLQHSSPPHPASPASASPRSAPAATRPAMTSATAPAATVRAYITAINRRDYAVAWRLGGAASGTTYRRFVARLAATRRDNLRIVSVSGGVVRAQLATVLAGGMVNHFRGTFLVRHGVIFAIYLTRYASVATAPASGAAAHGASPRTACPATATANFSADCYAASRGTITITAATGDPSPAGVDGNQAAQLADGDYLEYRDVNFGSGANHFTARVASGAPHGASGGVEVVLDNPASTPVAGFSIANTGGWSSWTTTGSNMTQVSGIHNVYIVLTSGGPAPYLSLHYFNFSGP